MKRTTPSERISQQANVFADGSGFQLATVTGDVAGGYTATLTVGVAAG